MAASTKTPLRQERWTYRRFTLTSGTIAYQGAICALDSSTGKVKPAVAGSSTLLPIGVFAENKDASSAEKQVNVQLCREVTVTWFANRSNGIAASDVGKLCYLYDDVTVTITATSNSAAGRIWAVDAAKGVAVEQDLLAQSVSTTPTITNFTNAAHDHHNAATGGLTAAASVTPGTAYQVLRTNSGATASEWGGVACPAGAAGSFTDGDWAPTSVVTGAAYAVPTTAAASTITLPAAAADGTLVYFYADGSANGHTVQYRDATGPTNLTTALTASKRHLVVCAKQASAWFANAYVSP